MTAWGIRARIADLQPWIDTSVAGLATTSAKLVAEEALRQGTLEWLERARQNGR